MIFFCEKNTSAIISDYSNHTYVNNAYQGLVTKFLSAVYSVASIRT